MLGIRMVHQQELMIHYLFRGHHCQCHIILVDNQQIPEHHTSNHGLLLIQINDLVVEDIKISLRTNLGLETIWKEGMLLSIQFICHTVNFCLSDSKLVGGS